MNKLRDEIIATANAIKTIKDLIDENIRDIGDDTTSEFAKLRLTQNANLLYAKRKLEETLEQYTFAD